MAIFEAIEDIWAQVRDFNDCTRALVTFATSIGAIVIIYYTLKIAYKSLLAFRLYCLSQCRWFCCTNLKQKYGQWAVISGATDGIGLAMARELARRGMSIIVIGRNEEKLTNTKNLLKEEPNVGEIVTVKIDLSDSSLENFDKIRSQIDAENRDIGILINNAGTFPAKFRRFNKFDSDDTRILINLNVLATIYLTRMIMPSMIVRGKGLLVNVSSTLGCAPSPYLNVYGATKSFMNAFSRQLQIEYSAHPIDIVNLTPGAVHTKLLMATSTLPRPTPLNPSPEDYARTALNALSAGINNYSGTALHGFVKEAMLLLDSIGLLPLVFKLSFYLNAKDLKLSPVLKRKQQTALNTKNDDGVRNNSSSAQ